MIKNSYNFKFIILVIFMMLLLLIFSMLSNIIYVDIVRKNNFEKDITKKFEMNSSSTFSLDKIFIFSSADAINNPVNNKAMWDINVFQFSDIAIYINNNKENGLSSQNTLKELYINNIKYNETPVLGKCDIYYKNLNDFGKLSYLEENKITDTFNFNVINENKSPDYVNKEIHTTISSPICFEFINKDIKTNYIISDISNPLVYDGSLLQKCNVPINDINCNFSFNVNIINNLDQHFICNVSISIPLKDDNQKISIYDGKIQKEINNLNKYKFYRIK